MLRFWVNTHRGITAALFLFMLAVCATGTIAAGLKVDSTNSERFSGVYKLPTGEFVYIQPLRGRAANLLYSTDAGEIRELAPAGAQMYAAGPGIFLATPVETTITFHGKTDDTEALTIRRQGLPEQTARRVDLYKRDDVHFLSDDIRLAGTLRTPLGAGPYPALVLLHGTGTEDRNNVLPLVHFLTRYGVALFSYDKRGTGESSGDGHAASLEELAEDAVAAVRYLRSRKEIDPRRLGVFGVSQGGWVAPLAASRSADIAFVISVSGPALSPAQIARNRLRHEMVSEGFREEEVAEALSLMDLRNEFARGKMNWEALAAAADQFRNRKWFQRIPLPDSKETYLHDHWPRILDYEPGVALEKLRVPALALFGGLDRLVLAEENSERWRAALQKGGNQDYTIKIFPRANHMLLEAETGRIEEYPSLKRFVPEYRSALLAWLKSRGVIE